MNEHLRQTFRTSRMLGNAVSLHAQGRAVCVYGLDNRHVSRLRGALGPHFEGIKIEVIPEDFDWVLMKAHRNMHPNCVCLVDHIVVEKRLQDLDEQILRLQQLARQLYHLTT